MNTRLFPSLQELSFNQLINTYGSEEIARIIKEDENAAALNQVSDYPGMRVYKPLLAKFQELVNSIVLVVVQGDLNQTETLIAQKPALSSEKGEAIDYSRRLVSDVTPFQAALCAWDDEMWEMLEKYMTSEEVAHQYQEIFPEGHEKYFADQTPFDFSVIVNAITQGSAADVQAALNKKQDDSLLCQSLNQFRADFTALSYQEKVFNPKHLIKALELYDQQFENWDWPKRDLFWRQVIGFTQRFLPANIAQDFAQGLNYRVEEKEKSRRSFNFRFGGGSIYPLIFDSLSGLGFDYAVRGRWGGAGEWSHCTPATGPAGPTQLPIARLFQNYLEQKHPTCKNLCSLQIVGHKRHRGVQ